MLPFSDHKICWKEANVLQTEPNRTYRKCKEAAHLVLVNHPFSQLILYISPIRTFITAAEVRKLQLWQLLTTLRIVILVMTLVLTEFCF
jgi:hypothetical protein